MDNKTTQDQPTRLEVATPGPLTVKGCFTLIGADGKEIHLDENAKNHGIHLCICGRSKHKPFCDGSHNKI